MITKTERMFYKKCLDMGINSISTKADIERAKLIAKDIGIIDYNNEEALKLRFNNIKAVIIEEEDKKISEWKQAELEKEKNREIDTESQLTKYANYYGRNKQIAYYSDLLEEARKPLNEYEDVKNAAEVAKTVYNALANSVEPQYKRKQDWSIAGGIASGLAGPAAGAAIASDIQRKNAEADVYNHKAYESANQQRKALRQKGDDYADSFMEKYNTPYERDKLKQAREQVRQYNKKIDKAKIKLIEERDPVELLAMLYPTVNSIETTKTGTVKSTISIKSCNVRIFETVNAVIDGSFSAVLWDDEDNIAGEITYVLPHNGSAEKQKITGLCTSAKYSKHYRIDFINPNLWLIESDTQTIAENHTDNTDFSKYKAKYETLITYYQACKLYEIDSITNLTKAISTFKSLDSYRESKERIKACKNKIYNFSLSKMNTGQVSDDKTAISGFKAILDWKDSKEKLKDAEKNIVYDKAVEATNKLNIGNIYEYGQIEKLNEAAEMFKSVSGWKDADEQAEILLKEIEKFKAKQKALEDKKLKHKKIFKILGVTISSAIAVVVAFVIVLNTVIIPKNKYNQALDYINDEDYVNANLILQELGNYKDSKQLMYDFSKFISANNYHTVGLMSDGTVVATGLNSDGQCDISGWTDIVAISAGIYNSVGLKSDGTVVATEYNRNNRVNNVSSWKDIVAISAGDCYIVGLKSDKTVVATGYTNYGHDVSDWKDIIAISSGYRHTIGLKSDKTVIATGSNDDGQCDVSDWTDIIAVSAGDCHTVGLKSDGTVVATGLNSDGQCDVLEWKEIIAVSAGDSHTVGLKSDGTVVTVGKNGDGQCDVSDWTDIIAVSAGACHTVGLKSDGTVVTAGNNQYNKCNVSRWQLW